jgi:hypothetical protein
VLANIVQMVSESLLQCTGFFRALAVIGAIVAILMMLATALSIAAGFDIVGFIAAYAVVFTASAFLLAAAAVAGPIRAASGFAGAYLSMARADEAQREPLG